MALQEEFRSQGDFLFRYRSYLPLVILVLGYAVFVREQFANIEIAETLWSDIFPFVCLGIGLLGFFIRANTVGHTPKNTSGRNTKEGQVAKVLNTSGMYSIVRHPLYLGNFFMWLSICMLTVNLWFIIAFVLLFVVYYERIMFAEEYFLRSRFGEPYHTWAAKTPAFIPNLKKYKSAHYPFSLIKIMKKEKNGFAALFALFWLFNFTKECIEEQAIILKIDFWFIAALTTGILYLMLKVAKKRKLLDLVSVPKTTVSK